MINENAMGLLSKGYLQEGETCWEDIAKRVANAIAQAEPKEVREKFTETFYSMISSMDFIPSTPCLINAGTDNQQLSSCFIIDLKDSIESIYEAKSEMAKIFQKNGGVGLNISVLRPMGAPVETSGGLSCGTLGFMEEFDLTADVVTRNNMRKGAIKVDLSDFHPDIIEFIKCKDDTTKLTRMNISVALSDRFMNAVLNDGDWNLEFPDYSWNKAIYNSEWNGDIEEWKSKGYPTIIYQTVKARELYHMIMEHAWKTGEPGVSFLDNMNKDNPNPHLGKANKSNPCFAGNMELLTDKGYKTFSSLDGHSVNIVAHNGEISTGRVWCNGIKEIINLELSDGEIIKCTPDHVFKLEDGSSCMAKDLSGKKVKRVHAKLTHDDRYVCLLNNRSTKIRNITNAGYEKVYDFSEPKTHWGIVNGVITHNCGEFISIPYNSCNLASINLSNMVQENEIDWRKLEETVNMSVRFLDDMVTANNLPLEKIERITKSVRSVGLGTMGFADMLYKLDIPYGSDECSKLIDLLYSKIMIWAMDSSRLLAEEKGCYDEWARSKWAKNELKMRNSNLLSIAPNGSIGFIANTSGGLEPNFALCYTRRMNDGTIFNIINPVFEERLKALGIYSDDLIQKIIDNNGSCQGIGEIPKEMQDVFLIASDISPDKHLRVLTEIQKHVDLSCSKTINLPNSAQISDIEDIYIKAWQQGAKGITIYRDGSRDIQTLSVAKNTTNDTDLLKRGYIVSVNDDLLSAKRTIINGCGKFYLHTDFDEQTGEMLETFIDIGSGGGCERNLQFISRLISLLLRVGVKPEQIIDQASSIRPCTAYNNRTKSKGDTSPGTSCPSAIGCAIDELNNKIQSRCFGDFIEKSHNEAAANEADTNETSVCPDCTSKLSYEGGCVICNNCGWSRCN